MLTDIIKCNVGEHTYHDSHWIKENGRWVFTDSWSRVEKFLRNHGYKIDNRTRCAVAIDCAWPADQDPNGEQSTWHRDGQPFARCLREGHVANVNPNIGELGKIDRLRPADAPEWIYATPHDDKTLDLFQRFHLAIHNGEFFKWQDTGRDTVVMTMVPRVLHRWLRRHTFHECVEQCIESLALFASYDTHNALRDCPEEWHDAVASRMRSVSVDSTSELARHLRMPIPPWLHHWEHHGNYGNIVQHHVFILPTYCLRDDDLKRKQKMHCVEGDKDALDYYLSLGA